MTPAKAGVAKARATCASIPHDFMNHTTDSARGAFWDCSFFIYFNSSSVRFNAPAMDLPPVKTV